MTNPTIYRMSLRQQALSRLAESQFSDGRVPLLKYFKEDFWPTALAPPAWHPGPEFKKRPGCVAAFLLSTRSVTLPNDPDEDQGHDSELSGWPWVEHTYAWVVPTSLVIIALKVQGIAQPPYRPVKREKDQAYVKKQKNRCGDACL